MDAWDARSTLARNDLSCYTNNVLKKRISQQKCPKHSFFQRGIPFLKNRKNSNNHKIHSFLLFSMIMRNNYHKCPISHFSHFIHVCTKRRNSCSHSPGTTVTSVPLVTLVTFVPKGDTLALAISKQLSQLSY